MPHTTTSDQPRHRSAHRSDSECLRLSISNYVSQSLKKLQYYSFGFYPKVSNNWDSGIGSFVSNLTRNTLICRIPESNILSFALTDEVHETPTKFEMSQHLLRDEIVNMAGVKVASYMPCTPTDAKECPPIPIDEMLLTFLKNNLDSTPIRDTGMANCDLKR